MGRRKRLSHLFAYALLLVSCDNPLGPTSTSIGRVDVQPGVVGLTVGASGSLRADVIDADGKAVAVRRVFWSSANTAVATVSQTGTVTAVGPGLVTIAASSGGKSGLATVTVSARPVSVVRVSPTSNQITVGSSVSLSAEALDAGGNAVAGKAFLWSSSNSAVATVSSTGIVTALAPGNATITATVDGVSGVASVTAAAVPVAALTISPPSGSVTVGQGVQLRATPVDAAGNVLSGRAIAWSSSSSSIATVSSTGLVVGLAAGQSTITASTEGINATAAVTVTLVPIDAMSVAPSQATIAAGATVDLTATARDVSGNVLGGRPVTWSSDQPATATVSPSGVVTGVSQGLARITAAAEGKSAVSLVTVTPVAINIIDVTPSTASLSIGGSTQLTATPRDAQGKPLAGRVITWITGAPSVATVSQGGLVVAVGAGDAIIFAASEGVSGSASVTVSQIPVSRVVVTPSTASITVGGFVQLGVEALDAQGNTLTGRVVAWSSSNQAIAVVSSTGRVQSVSPGTVAITATVEGISGTSTVTMTNVPVASVLVTPSSATLVIGQSTTLLATPRDAQGNQLVGRSTAWTSSNPAIATVSAATGDVTALAVGTVQVTATCEGITGTSAITVTSVPVGGVSVSPVVASLNAGQTQSLTVTVRDAGNNLLVGRTVSFASTNPAAATVAPASGTTNAVGQAFAIITAVSAGATTITASSGGQQATSTITVAVVPIASIVVTPSAPSVVEGRTVQLTATALDAGGAPLTGRTIVWASNNPNVSVSQSGLVTAIANIGGQAATVTASSPGGGLGGTSPSGAVTVTVVLAPVATVTVTPSPAAVTVGAATTLALTLKDAGNLALNLAGRTITWTSQNTAIATVTSAGVVTGVAAGATTVTVSAGSPQQATAVTQIVTVTVSSVPVASVSITPLTASLTTGQTQQMTVTVRDAGNNPLAGRTVDLTSSDVSAATVSPASTSTDAAGVAVATVTAVSSGATTITAASGSVQATATITVSAVPIAAITVTPATPSVQEGLQVQLTATATDAGGGTLTGRTIVWVSDNAAVSVSQTGLVTAIANAAGQSATITASSPGGGPGGTTPSGTAAVTVTYAPVATMIVAPSPVTVTVNANTTLTLTLQDAGGNTLSPAGRTIGWSSQNTAVVSVSNTGVVTGVATGTATVTASAQSPGQATPVTLVVTVNVTNVAVASVTVTPSPTATVHVGSLYQRMFTAVAKDAGGNVLTGRQIVWSSSNPSVATVDPLTGLVTGVSLGSATITATSESVNGTSAVTVDLVPVSTVTMSQATATLVPPQTVQLSATPQDSAGNTLSGVALGGRSTTWASSNIAAATVTTAGLVTAVGAVGATVSITASIGGTDGTTIVTVLAPVASVSLTAFNPDSVIAPGTVNGTATVADAATNPLAGRIVTFISSLPSRAAVTSSGTTDALGQVAFIVQGIEAAGGPVTVNITATSETQSSLAEPVKVRNPVSSISLAAAQDSVIGPGGTVVTTVTLKDAFNNTITGRAVAYSSANTAVATVHPATGVITAVGAGTTMITATSESKSGSTNFRVLAAVATVVASAPADSVIPSQTVQAAATLRDANSNVLTGRPVSWTSSAPGVATVDPTTGLITGVAPGSTTITASSEGQNGTLAFRVIPPINAISLTSAGDSVIGTGTLAVTATARDAGSTPLPGRTLTLTSSTPSVATVAPGGGQTNVTGQLAVTVTGVTPGTTSIAAAAEGKTATLIVRVLAAVATVSVTTPSDSLIGVGTLQATTVLKDASNNTLAGRPIGYASSNNSIATVDAITGLITSVAAGSVTISATSEGITGNVVIRVLAPVATVTAVAAPDSIAPGATVVATATLKDASNNTVTGRPIAWTSAAPGIATVSSTTGLVTGVAPGSTTITAISEGKSGTFTVRVIPGIDAIALTSASDSVIGTGTIALTATATDAGSTAIAGRTLAVSSSDVAVATVAPASGSTDALGQLAVTATAVSPGTATISATAEGKTGTRVVRMLAAVATVLVTTPGDSIIGTGTLQASTVLKDASSNTLTGRPIAYSTSNGGIATVNPSTGLVTGVSAGVVTITATSETKTGTVTIRVLAPVATVTVTAPTDSVIPGTVTLQATAVLKDAANNILTGRTLTWASSNVALATVSSTGLISGAGTVSGSVDVSATSEGVTSNQLPVRVLAPVGSVVLTAPDSSIDIGSSVQAAATTKDLAGNTLTGRVVTWQSSTAPSIATVSASGLVSAIAPGQISVVAVSEGISGLIPVFRSLGPVTTVSISPATVTINQLATTPLTVTVTDGAAFSPNPLAGIACTNTSANPLIAGPVNNNSTSNASGQFTVTVLGGIFNGTATIRVTCNGVQGTSAVTVQ